MTQQPVIASNDSEDLSAGAVAPSSDLALDYLWLADAIARRFHGRGEDDDDLRQVARCGLLEAANRYDPDRGPFASFASPTICGVIKRHFRDHGWSVRPPRQTQQLALKINQQWSQVAQDGHEPTDHDLAINLEESVTHIREARSASQGYRTLSIDAASVPDAATAINDPGFDLCEATMLIAQAWRSLNDAEQDLLRMRFWENRSQSDIAQRIGASQMQVSRLLTRTLAHLRRILDTDANSPAA